jgi:hypothetical protein
LDRRYIGASGYKRGVAAANDSLPMVIVRRGRAIGKLALAAATHDCPEIVLTASGKMSLDHVTPAQSLPST